MKKVKKVMFYCQHILGIGYLVRSLEIVRGLVQDYQNGLSRLPYLLEEVVTPSEYPRQKAL